MVLPARDVFTDEPAHVTPVEVLAYKRRAAEHVLGLLPKRRLQPLLHRDAEPFLAPVYYPLRQPALECLPQYMLPLAGLHEHPRRQGRAELEQLVVKERGAHLERVSHAR